MRSPETGIQILPLPLTSFMALEGHPEVQFSRNSRGGVTVDLAGRWGGLNEAAVFSAQPSAWHGLGVQCVLLADVILRPPL